MISAWRSSHAQCAASALARSCDSYAYLHPPFPRISSNCFVFQFKNFEPVHEVPAITTKRSQDLNSNHDPAGQDPRLLLVFLHGR
jgi:hypothetical protein